MALKVQIAGTKNCEGGVDLKLIVNGQPYHEGRVFQSLSDAVASVDEHPMDVDDLIWIIRRIARVQNLTPAQVFAKTLTVDFTSPNVVTFL